MTDWTPQSPYPDHWYRLYPGRGIWLLWLSKIHPGQYRLEYHDGQRWKTRLFNTIERAKEWADEEAKRS